MPNFHNFTSLAKEVIRRAHELAIERGQNHVNPTHLLAALTMQDESVVIAVLDRLEIDVIAFTDLLVDALEGSETSSNVSQSYQLYLTPELAQLLKASERIMERLGDTYVGVEHLFLAALDHPGPAEKILKQAGISKSKVVATIQEVRESGITDAKTPRKNRALNLSLIHISEPTRPY